MVIYTQDKGKKAENKEFGSKSILRSKSIREAVYLISGLCSVLLGVKCGELHNVCSVLITKVENIALYTSFLGCVVIREIQDDEHHLMFSCVMVFMNIETTSS